MNESASEWKPLKEEYIIEMSIIVEQCVFCGFKVIQDD